MMPERLLAKKVTRDGREVTLLEHSLATENAAIALFKENSRFLNNWLRFFKVDPDEKDKFLLNLRVSALLHDIGKANKDFQEAVSGQGYLQQGIRHEHLSAFILHLPAIRSWFSENKIIDIKIITSAILCHHLKATGDNVNEHQFMYKWGNVLRPEVKLPVYLEHKDIQGILTHIGNLLQLKAESVLNLPFFQLTVEPWSEVFKSALREGMNISFKNYLENDKKYPLFLAVKAGLVAADSVASGLVRENRSVNEWINNVVHLSEIKPDEILKAIILPRRQDITHKSGKSFEFHEFQKRITQKGNRVLLLAGCGMGKTLAAWNWANEISRKQKISKVIFLYPTRGTATEGFKDYVSWAPEADASLLHGTSEYELDTMFDNPDETQKNQKYKIKEEDERLFALAYWSKKFFSATADQFLSFLQNNYKGLCLLPALTECALIVDEVHSFDKNMFASLLSFLKNFDLPVLCMTATLTPKNKKSLIELGLNPYPTESDRTELADLEQLEEHPRYNKTILDNAESAFEIAVNAYHEGRRVLWVANTVQRCQDMHQQLCDELKTAVHCYHSRFKLEDRKDVHKKTVEAFKSGSSGKNAIAVTTQVCEMSLDLDADVLITEVAPISSMVQRFGRANRDSKKNGNDFRAELYLYKPEGSLLPYTVDEIKMAENFLAALPEKDISHRLLAQKLEEFTGEQYRTLPSASFTDGGYYALQSDFRDIDEFTNPAILDTDYPEVSDLLKNKKSIDGYILPAPAKQELFLQNELYSALPHYLQVVSSRNYSAIRGFAI
ncbi:MAG: CRISPR-associated helicase Cas3' [Spirochaetia bacterium]|nr:CRISPR-associated helicase Cas3' [Spirochaetia bacterium]